MIKKQLYITYPEWASEVEYLKGFNVIYDDKIYECIETHSSSDTFEEDKWGEVVVSFDILLTANVNDIGVKEPYVDPELVLDEIDTTTNVVTYSGESRIDEFKRYGKTINDSDLYNTEYEITKGGISKEILEIKPKVNPFGKQDVYKYTFTDLKDNVTTYDDVGDGSSIITYTAKGLNEDNATNLPSFKNEELLGVIGKPKVEVDVFIDRGINNSFDKHIKISEIKTLEALEKYGNGFFKIKE